MAYVSAIAAYEVSASVTRRLQSRGRGAGTIVLLLLLQLQLNLLLLHLRLMVHRHPVVSMRRHHLAPKISVVIGLASRRIFETSVVGLHLRMHQGRWRKKVRIQIRESQGGVNHLRYHRMIGELVAARS